MSYCQTNGLERKLLYNNLSILKRWVYFPVTQISYDEDTDLDKIVDDSGAILFGNQKNRKTSDEGEEIDALPLLFNGDGEVFYYKDGKNNLRISYRSWDLEDDEQDE